MSLTRHEEIGRVGRVGRGCYEDASDLPATSRACRARRVWRTTGHTDKRVIISNIISISISNNFLSVENKSEMLRFRVIVTSEQEMRRCRGIKASDTDRRLRARRIVMTDRCC